MNKELFIKELESVTGLNNDKCLIINDVLENHFIIGKNNKEKIINEIVTKLGITNTEAEKIYEASMSIISTGIKDKIKHPFRNQD